MTTCAFPNCATPPTTQNRAGKETCAYHEAVVVADGGSWMSEGRGHREPKEDDQ